MESFEKLQESLLRELGKISREEEKSLAKLRERYNREKDKAEQKYARQAAGRVSQNLTRHYKTLQERSPVADIDAEESERAEEVRNAIKDIDDETTRQNVLKVMRLPETTQKAVELLTQSEGFDKERIVSYMAEGQTDKGANVCYLLLPVAGQNNRSLARSLEDRLFGVLEGGSITTGFAVTSEVNGVVGGKSREIRFKTDIDYVKNKDSDEFLLWEMIPDNGGSAKELAIKMAKKLNQAHIQPEGFDRAQLEHRVELIAPQIMKYVVEHDISELLAKAPVLEEEQISRVPRKITDTYVAKMTGLTVQGVKRLATLGKSFERDAEGNITLESLNAYRVQHGRQPIELPEYRRKPQTSRTSATPSGRESYSLTDSAQMKARAYETLNRIEPQTLEGHEGKYLTTQQLAEVLGVGGKFLTRFKNDVPYVQIGRRIYFKIEGLKKFVDERTPTKSGWRKQQ